MPSLGVHHHRRPDPATPLGALDAARRPIIEIIMDTNTAGAAPAVSFVASYAFIAALDQAAGQLGTTRSHYVRTVLVRHLRDAGLLAVDAPVTHHDAKRQAGR